MNFQQFLNESEESRWPLYDESAKVERAIKRKKFDYQRERALRDVLEAEIDFSKVTDKAEAKKYAKLAKETIKKSKTAKVNIVSLLLFHLKNKTNDIKEYGVYMKIDSRKKN